MKTQTNRIHRNGASKRTTSQVKTHRAKASAGSARQPGLVADLPLNGGCLLFFSQSDDATLASVEVSPARLQALERTAKNRGLTIEQLMNEGIGEILTRLEAAPDIGLAELELDLARLQANALMVLLADQFKNVAKAGISFEGKWAENLCEGFEQLASVRQERLDRTAAEFRQTVVSNLGEVVA